MLILSSSLSLSLPLTSFSDSSVDSNSILGEGSKQFLEKLNSGGPNIEGMHTPQFH